MNQMDKIKPICIVEVELAGIRIYGDSNSVVFDNTEAEEQFELTWPEIYQLCKKWHNT